MWSHTTSCTNVILNNTHVRFSTVPHHSSTQTQGMLTTDCKHSIDKKELHASVQGVDSVYSKVRPWLPSCSTKMRQHHHKGRNETSVLAFYSEEPLALTQPPSWKTIFCCLLMATYSIYVQLLFKFWGHPFRLKLEDGIPHLMQKYLVPII
jgi:hypothetical protein